MAILKTSVAFSFVLLACLYILNTVVKIIRNTLIVTGVCFLFYKESIFPLKEIYFDILEMHGFYSAKHVWYCR